MASINALPPIPQDKIEENPRWRDWFNNLGTYIKTIQNAGLGTLSSQNSDSVNITGGSITGVAIPYTDITGLATVAHTGDYADLIGKPTGLSVTITTAKLTTLGSNGSMTFTNGILTSQIQAT